MDMNRIEFNRADINSLYNLHRLGYRDAWWPRALKEPDSVQPWIDNWDMLSWFEDGQADVITADEQLLGYCTTRRVPKHFTPNTKEAVECGTFLLPEARGIGLNRLVKTHLTGLATTRYHANCVLYLVDPANERAKRAMLGLPYAITTITLAMNEHPWYPFLKRRCFEESSQLILFEQDLA